MSISHPIADDPVPQFMGLGAHAVAGRSVIEAIYREIEERCPKRGDKFDSGQLAVIHAQQAVRGFVGAEIKPCASPTGRLTYALQYDSGLQGFDLIESGFATLADAEAFARRWAEADPAYRYAWMWASERPE